MHDHKLNRIQLKRLFVRRPELEHGMLGPFQKRYVSRKSAAKWITTTPKSMALAKKNG